MILLLFLFLSGILGLVWAYMNYSKLVQTTSYGD